MSWAASPPQDPAVLRLIHRNSHAAVPALTRRLHSGPLTGRVA